MANRKKAEEAAIKFSVETSTPAQPTPAAPKPAKPNPVTGSEALPGLRKSQREAATPVHPRAAADQKKRQAEVAAGIDEARMPKQSEAEERWKSDRKTYTDEDRKAFAARKEAKRKADLKEYLNAPVSANEVARAKKLAGTRVVRRRGK